MAVSSYSDTYPRTTGHYNPIDITTATISTPTNIRQPPVKQRHRGGWEKVEKTKKTGGKQHISLPSIRATKMPPSPKLHIKERKGVEAKRRDLLKSCTKKSSRKKSNKQRDKKIHPEEKGAKIDFPRNLRRPTTNQRPRNPCPADPSHRK
ncbi:hypothetical protein CHS0354_038088 [Potamilus streckersoni]|uniref:Uncharacterized protein n=1 Tax=Potamilus streckersoni TaxID=2493646 RepID=A0AAE0SSE2_9BIVA|nr:hypothetical protein CHS0354_038088 [Potamilus streckersoni]